MEQETVTSLDGICHQWPVVNRSALFQHSPQPLYFSVYSVQMEPISINHLDSLIKWDPGYTGKISELYSSDKSTEM